MSAPEPASEPQKEMPSRYEKPSLEGKPFVIGAICFFVLMLAIFGVAWGLLRHWSNKPWPRHGPPASPLADTRWKLKAPQIQIDPAIDLKNLRQSEARRLHTLRWNDASHAYATIPIEAAMKLLSDAAAKNQLTTVLPAPQPATPVQLQDQKSREAATPQLPNP